MRSTLLLANASEGTAAFLARSHLPMRKRHVQHAMARAACYGLFELQQPEMMAAKGVANSEMRAKRVANSRCIALLTTLTWLDMSPQTKAPRRTTLQYEYKVISCALRSGRTLATRINMFSVQASIKIWQVASATPGSNMRF